ncbi:hypothetical protein K443DRAFT_655462 [Laccaria amethystina LaAM-08-1]|uniref:Uncharacterized protein n=1 Tax=Laccaria amethystina LaAM-08-1 TaxID=1095629 RepID=A0A0C9X9F1_9AGAR|nr:hypothetical protein K443DRAFT_655462 [Laccaria amethystina LaAM-08-1]
MPRGIPNAKRDETGMRYTTFNVPLAPNPKHVSSTYLKSESQTLWARNALRKSNAVVVEEGILDQRRRGSQVLVIHPGSCYLRIGKASDVNPVTVPAVVARKHTSAPPEIIRVENVCRPRDNTPGSQKNDTQRNGDEYDVSTASNDPFDAKLAAITLSLRDRMRFYKLRVTPNATKIASTFNEQFKPEVITDHEALEMEWIDDSCFEDVLALQIADPHLSNYAVRWPILASNFNTKDYRSIQANLSDLEALIQYTLWDRLNITSTDYKRYSVVLVIPDIYDRAYIREFVNLVVVMGFKQFCAQQESLAATYGAGISNACVVDIGAKVTSIACVDEGLVLSETRMTLNMGGDDITEFLYVLLGRINFPYKNLDLSRSYDWSVLEDLKSRLCTLAEGDVALNLYDFIVRKPNRPTEKYGLRAYDEIILAPMPRVIEFNNKREGVRLISLNVTEEIIDHQADCVTNAMVISTQHLMPPPQSTDSTKQTPTTAAPTPGTLTPAKVESTSTDVLSMVIDMQSIPAPTDAPSEAVLEVIDVDDDSKLPTLHNLQHASQLQASTYPGGYSIDVCFEASKLPLDVAIFNSARAAGGDDKIRKYLQAVLVIGGTALIPGMAHALESRLQAIATPLVPNMEKVQIIPPPKEVDPRVLAWKGASVLGKMDGASDLWVTPSDWVCINLVFAAFRILIYIQDTFGMRSLKEKCFYL